MCNDKKCIAVYDLIERSIRIQVLAWTYDSEYDKLTQSLNKRQLFVLREPWIRI